MKSLYSLSGGFCHSNAAQNNQSPRGLCDGIHGQGQRNLALTSAKIIHRFIFIFNKVFCYSQWDTVSPHLLLASLTTGTILLTYSSHYKFCLSYKEKKKVCVGGILSNVYDRNCLGKQS